MDFSDVVDNDVREVFCIKMIKSEWKELFLQKQDLNFFMKN